MLQPRRERALSLCLTDAFTHSLRTQTPRFSRQLHLSLCGSEKAAEHLDGCRLSGTVRSKQAVDLSVLNLDAHVLDCSKLSELLRQILCPDCDLSAQVTVIMMSGESFGANLLPKTSQGRYECIFERRLGALMDLTVSRLRSL